MQEWGYFGLVYFDQSLMKQQNHETKGSMKLTGRDNMYYQVHEINK